MARIRSPNYPQLSLPESLIRIDQVFSKERKHAAPKEVIIGHLGYSSVNGASLGALSALLKYGLLDRDGDSFRVSDRAVSILHPSSDQEKAEALRAAAYAPPLFAEILEAFKGEIPSDANLRAYLIRRGFSENAIGQVIAKLRETMDLIPSEAPSGQIGSGVVVATGAKMLQPSMGSAATGMQSFQSSEIQAPKPTRLRVSLTDSGLDISAGLTDQKGVERLIAILEANKLLLPVESDKSRQDPVDPGVAADGEGEDVN